MAEDKNDLGGEDWQVITFSIPEAWRGKVKPGEPIGIEFDLDDNSGFKQDYYRVKMPLKEVKQGG